MSTRVTCLRNTRQDCSSSEFLPRTALVVIEIKFIASSTIFASFFPVFDLWFIFTRIVLDFMIPIYTSLFLYLVLA